MQGLTKAVDALAKDVLERMVAFGKWLKALEVQPAPRPADQPPQDDTSTAMPEVQELLLSNTSSTAPEVQGLLLSNTLIPAPEVQRRGDDSSPTNDQMIPWADRSVSSTADYEETLSWLDEEEDELSSSTTKLFAVSENTSKLLKESF